MDAEPENIIRFSEQGADGPRDRVRLIDFGAVRKLGRPGPVDMYTYAPPKTERASVTRRCEQRDLPAEPGADPVDVSLVRS